MRMKSAVESQFLFTTTYAELLVAYADLNNDFLGLGRWLRARGCASPSRGVGETPTSQSDVECLDNKRRYRAGSRWKTGA